MEVLRVITSSLLILHFFLQNSNILCPVSSITPHLFVMLHFTCRCQVSGLLFIFEKCLALFLPLASATNGLWLIILSHCTFQNWSCKWNVPQQLNNHHNANAAHGVCTVRVRVFWLGVWGEGWLSFGYYGCISP